ncbi:MAG: shikimate kinase [Geopsychrobacter sp.]|nr:shikimate kinase [Geopsychrobacter sp.]
MSRANIILTGFMGTGKSTIGRQLADTLNYRFVDTDQLIEEQIGQTIAELFEQQGESVFRQKEQQLAKTLAQETGLVIATGGGLMLNPMNIEVLSHTGQIFCLTAQPEEILARISSQQHIRPLLKDPDPLARIKELLEQRKACYQQFPQIETSSRNLKQLVADLTQRVQDPDRP